MSTLKEIRSLYAPLTPTSAEPRAYVGRAAPGDYRHIFGDDGDDYAPSGPSFPTKAEALATISARAAEYYGTAPPELDLYALRKIFQQRELEMLRLRDRPNNGSITSRESAARADGQAYGVRWALAEIEKFLSQD